MDSAEDIRQDKKGSSGQAYQAEKKLEKKEEQGMMFSYSPIDKMTGRVVEGTYYGPEGFRNIPYSVRLTPNDRFVGATISTMRYHQSMSVPNAVLMDLAKKVRQIYKVKGNMQFEWD